MSDADVRRLRATKVSMVYQNPTGALNPSLRIGDQVAEGYTLQGVKDDEAHERARAMLEKVQISDPDGRDAALPAPALGRHEPARDHRDGAGQGPDAADPRRADDRPRRDRRERGARPRRRAPRRVQVQRPVHQPQPRRDRPDVRPRRRPLRRPRRRAGHRRRGLQQPAPPLHGRAPALHPARRRDEGEGQARHDPRLPPRPRRRAARLRVRRPLRAEAGHLRREGARPLRARRRPPQPLPLPREGAGAAARGEPRADQDRAGRTATRRRSCARRACARRSTRTGTTSARSRT